MVNEEKHEIRVRQMRRRWMPVDLLLFCSFFFLLLFFLLQHATSPSGCLISIWQTTDWKWLLCCSIARQYTSKFEGLMTVSIDSLGWATIEDWNIQHRGSLLWCHSMTGQLVMRSKIINNDQSWMDRFRYYLLPITSSVWWEFLPKSPWQNLSLKYIKEDPKLSNPILSHTQYL